MYKGLFINTITTAADKKVKFSSTVEFIGTNEQVKFGTPANVTFGGDVILSNSKNPVDLTSGYTGITSLTYSQIFAGSAAYNDNFDFPVTFSKGIVTDKDENKAIILTAGVTVNGPIVTSRAVIVSEVGGSEAIFKSGDLNFGSAAVFGGPVTIDNSVTFGTTATFKNNAAFGGLVKFNKSDDIVFSNTASHNVIFAKLYNNSYNILKMPANVVFNDTVTVGTVATFSGSRAVFNKDVAFDKVVTFAANAEFNGSATFCCREWL